MKMSKTNKINKVNNQPEEPLPAEEVNSKTVVTYVRYTGSLRIEIPTPLNDEEFKTVQRAIDSALNIIGK